MAEGKVVEYAPTPPRVGAEPEADAALWRSDGRERDSGYFEQVQADGDLQFGRAVFCPNVVESACFDRRIYCFGSYKTSGGSKDRKPKDKILSGVFF